MVLEGALNKPVNPVHLSNNHYNVLNNLKENGSKAHTIVSQFKTLHPEVSDQSIILGLQEML